MICSYMIVLAIAMSASAMPDECFSDKINKYDALKATHFMSHCLVQSVFEESAVPPDEEELRYGPHFDCSYRSLRGLNADESMVFIMTCLLQKARHAGDPPHLNADVIYQRISSAATDLYAGVDDIGDCSPEKLEHVSYEDAKSNVSEYGQCIIIQTLQDLTHPEDLENIDF